MSRARVFWPTLQSSQSVWKGLFCLLLLASARDGAGQDQQGLTELRARAETAYAEGRLMDALSDYERLVSLFPEEGCLYGRLAGCALREPGRLTLARRHLRIAIKLGCGDVDLEFHRARMAQLEYDFDRARDLYAAYVAAAGKKGQFREEALDAGNICGSAIWDPSEAIALEVLDRFPADPKGAFRFYRPETPGLRLVNTPQALRSKADAKVEPGRIAFHNGDTVLVYASLGKSGKTGWDLYRIELTGGQYGEAERLSDSINTPYDEQGAYLSKDGVLYFSSNRPGGLGGQDIYAVPWGQDGPVGRPERLPFPVNSVNDDEFFIPEPDGGAWMSSNRAAREGRIHAYRVALSALPIDAGSVSWLADEVASEGMTLRVYSRGEEVVTRALNGEGAEHEALPVDEGALGVRIVLENEQGEIVSETYGAGASSWDLRKQGRGWTLVERADVDWAMLADLHALDSKGLASGPDGAVQDESTVADDGGQRDAIRWGSWVKEWREDLATVAEEPGDAGEEDDIRASREVSSDSQSSEVAMGGLVPEPTSSSGGSEDSVADVVLLPRPALGETDSGQVSVAMSSEQESNGDSVAEAEKGNGDESTEEPVSDALSAERSGQQPEATSGEVRNVAGILAEQDAPTEEELAALLEKEPASLIAVWNEKAVVLLKEEADFLDNPDMTKAGNLSELVEDLADWQPDVDMMDGRLQDGAAMEEVREMIETWTYAVQSATKASLAEVAGDAALAYRRERLALREIAETTGVDLGRAVQGASGWQDAQRDAMLDTQQVPLEMDGSMPDWLTEWEGGLERASDLWTRKERSGWRGDWVRRQERHLDVVRAQWGAHLAALAESNDGAVSEAPAPTSGRDDLDFLETPFGESSMQTMARFVLGRPMTQDPENEVDEVWGNVVLSDIVDAWEQSLQESRSIERGWDRLMKLTEGQGIPVVHKEADFALLNADVAAQWLDLKQDMLVLLAEVVNRNQGDIVREKTFWQEVEARQEQESESILSDVLEQRRRVQDLVMEVEKVRLEADRAQGVERFHAQRMWHDAMLELAVTQDALMEAILEAEIELERLNVDAAEDAVAMQAIAEAQRLKTERVEAERLEAERLEAERIEAERLEAERIEAERLEAERMEAARLEAERIEAERLEAERIEAERLEAERMEAEQREAERVAAELAIDENPSTLGGADESVVRDAFSGELPPGWTWLDGAEVVESAAVLNQGQEGNGAELSWTAAEMALIEAWVRLRDASVAEPGAFADRRARREKEKTVFFAKRDLQDALLMVDLAFMRARVDAGAEPMSDVVLREAEETEKAENGVAVQPEVVDGLNRVETRDVERRGVEKDAVSMSESALEEEVSSVYGVSLPAAEVVGEGRRSDSGIRLRPIQREEMERAIIGTWAEQPEAERVFAAETYGEPAGRPRDVGVEYKVQIGAFRNPLPAALFAAFDPMWAQRSSSGITRYMAGSFDAYDPAVVARDAIRALGYSDAFVVRFVDGERVRGSRPAPEALAQERLDLATVGRVPASSSTSPSPVSSDPETVGARADAIPTRREDIETWSDVQGRVYSVQVGAFRGVPDRRALSTLGTLTREDAGSDGWLRLFSGRFETETEARAHLSALKQEGRADAFVVVYINGRRIPLLQASTTATGGLDVVNRPVAPSRDERPAAFDSGFALLDNAGADPDSSLPQWRVELGEYTSTIPVRLANAILDAPLEWEVRSRRDGGVTRYITRFSQEKGQAERWLAEAKAMGFSRARLLTGE